MENFNIDSNNEPTSAANSTSYILCKQNATSPKHPQVGDRNLNISFNRPLITRTWYDGNKAMTNKL